MEGFLCDELEEKSSKFDEYMKIVRNLKCLVDSNDLTENEMKMVLKAYWKSI